MRFNDGFWLLKHGVKPFYGLQVVQSTQTEDGFNLQVSTRPIRHRGDTLGGPVLSVKVHSPTEGVIGVKIDHFKVFLQPCEYCLLVLMPNEACRTFPKYSLVSQRPAFPECFSEFKRRKP